MKAAPMIAILWAAAQGGNLAATSGSYGASLGAGAAVATERDAFGQNPAALRPGSSGIHLDAYRPYGLGDLRIVDAGAFFDGGRAGLACDWRATEITDLYSEQGARLAASLRLSGHGFPGRMDLGYAWEAWRTAEAGAAERWDFAQESGAVWRPCERLAFGAFAAGWPDWPGRGPRQRVFQFGMEADSRDPASEAGFLQIVRLDFRKTDALPWRALASASLRLHPSLEFTAAAATPPFQLSAGLALAWRGVRVRQAFRYHRYLGRTWLSGLDYVRPSS